MSKQSRASRLVAAATVIVVSAGASLIGCGGGGNLSEADVVAKLQATGLKVEKLPRPTWTRSQRERVEQEPESVFSLKLTDGDQHQEVTLLGFDAEWKAEGVAPDGVPGFAVGKWFFVGEIGQSFREKIEAALQ